MALKTCGEIRSVRFVINVRLTEFNNNLDDTVYEICRMYGAIKRSIVQRL